MDNIRRSPLLTALCILSFAGNLIGFLLYLSAAIMNREARILIMEMSDTRETSPYTVAYFSIFALLYAISFTGVRKMWQLKKSGFWFYLFSQSVILVLPYIWPGDQAFSSVAVIFTLLFVILFGFQMRKI
jgi:hypothetical protein